MPSSRPVLCRPAHACLDRGPCERESGSGRRPSTYRIRASGGTARSVAPCFGEVRGRCRRSVGEQRAPNRYSILDSAPPRPYDVGRSRAVRTERSPSPPHRGLGDPEVIAWHGSRRTGESTRAPPLSFRCPTSGFVPLFGPHPRISSTAIATPGSSSGRSISPRVTVTISAYPSGPGCRHTLIASPARSTNQASGMPAAA